MTCEDRARMNDSNCDLKITFDIQDFIWPNDSTKEQVIVFKGSPQFGVANPLQPWEYTVYGQQVLVCVKEFLDMPFLPASESTLAVLTSVLLMASIVGLYATILTHLIFSELRNLPGLNLLAMNVTMVTYQQIFVIGVHADTGFRACKSVAVCLHFFILSTFFWTNIMAWDLYQTFGKRAVFSQIRY
jgi:hypothetical protein